MTKRQEPPPISVRLPKDLYDALRAATDKDRDAYAPTMNAIAVRGIALALKELARKRK